MDTGDVAGDSEGTGEGSRAGGRSFSLSWGDKVDVGRGGTGGVGEGSAGGGVVERVEVTLGDRRPDSVLTDLNELGAKPFVVCVLGELTLGESGVRFVKTGEVAPRPPSVEPLELERAGPPRDEGVTLPGVVRGFAGEPGRAVLELAGDVDVLFSHMDAAARTLLGPPAPPLDVEPVRGLDGVLSAEGLVDGLVELKSSAGGDAEKSGVSRSTSSAPSFLEGEDIGERNRSGAMW